MFRPVRRKAATARPRLKRPSPFESIKKLLPLALLRKQAPAPFAYADYPHIVEAIIQQCDHATKLKARLACSALRTAVDRTLRGRALHIRPRWWGREFTVTCEHGGLPWFHPRGDRGLALRTMMAASSITIAGHVRGAGLARLNYWLFFLPERCIVTLVHDGAWPRGTGLRLVLPRRLVIQRNEYCGCARRTPARLEHGADEIVLRLSQMRVRRLRTVLSAARHLCRSDCALTNSIIDRHVKRLLVEVSPQRYGRLVSLSGFFFADHITHHGAISDDLRIVLAQYDAEPGELEFCRLQLAWDLRVHPDRVTALNLKAAHGVIDEYWNP